MAFAELLARLAGVRTLGVDLGLDRVRLALRRLGDPQRRFAAVQIAGTNGKGSTAAMTEAVLREAGWRTGLYSSPHLARFTERIGSRSGWSRSRVCSGSTRSSISIRVGPVYHGIAAESARTLSPFSAALGTEPTADNPSGAASVPNSCTMRAKTAGG